ncbi:DNA-processing protein DprA [Marinicella sp. W31]|uniref:DNA-processing protein DprA n=1 Tax=Marinicella sp. W31 TaxID=3023713 RepID=UPI003756EDCC
MDLSDTEAWLRLINAPGLGAIRINQLLQEFGSVQNIIECKNVPEHFKIPKQALDYLQSPDTAVEQALTWLEGENNHLLTITDALYPPLLRQSQQPPAALFVRGQPGSLLLPQLAVVGSRNASQAGRKNARAFCRDLAAGGLTITSGLALGIDSIAHQAAIDAGGTSVAVMGTGINLIYPRANKNLAKSLCEQGAVVTELPLNSHPAASHFPMRNRIISGLSLGTLVIEAGVKSGTLITARLTMENNRPVMAIPGSIHNPLSKGCHALIKQGARLVESADEILQELKPLAAALSEDLRKVLKVQNKEQEIEIPDKDPTSDLTESQRKVLSCISYEPTPMELILESCELSIQSLSSILLILELENLVEKLPGAQYQRI